jgi:hypothetical protein
LLFDDEQLNKESSTLAPEPSEVTRIEDCAATEPVAVVWCPIKKLMSAFSIAIHGSSVRPSTASFIFLLVTAS